VELGALLSTAEKSSSSGEASRNAARAPPAALCMMKAPETPSFERASKRPAQDGCEKDLASHLVDSQLWELRQYLDSFVPA